jgi:hypothetical protein
MRSTHLTTLLALFLGYPLAMPLMAQQPPAPATAPAGPPAKCDAPVYRQLDFWVGEWDVYIGDQKVGTNVVTSEEDGCVVHEHWTSLRSETGQSFNFYDRATKKWRQVWVSNNGSTLDVAGGLVDGTMAYTGEAVRPNGVRIQHRLSFTPNADGTVRQFWQTSTDGGATWTVAWDGRYVRKAK